MRAEEKVFKAFYDTKERKLYYNQIKEITHLSHSSLQNALEKLLQQKAVSEEKTKAHTFYAIHDKKLFALKFSENSLRAFNNLNHGVKSPLRNFLERLPQEIFTIILFGSASRREEQKESDIDLLVVTNERIDLEQQKKEAEATSRYPLSLFQCNIKQFIDNKDPVIVQARNTGFPIYKEQNFFEVELDEY